jgi:hypothetical protein
VLPQILVISDPPHRDVDQEVVASILGLESDDARLKIGFAAPEVLSASDPARANEVAASLRSAGLSVAVIDGHAMAGIPWPTLVSSFEFGSQGLIARSGENVVEVRYETPVAVVYCKPPPDFPRGGPGGGATDSKAAAGDGFTATETIEWMARLDLYFTQNEALRRISIVDDVTDFSGLGGRSEPSADEGLAATLSECRSRFAHLAVDSRLENVRPRQRFIAGERGFDLDLRKAFSFGTLLLRQVLDSISPELRDIPQYEYGSRVAYLLNGTRREA